MWLGARELEGAGDGTFAAEQRFAAGGRPQSVSIGDLDGDSVPDIAVANEDTDDVSVLLGAGDGTFAPEQRFGTGNGPASVSIGDLDGDGAPDLAVANAFSDDVSVLLGAGDGTFAAEQRFGAGDRPESVSIGDLDGDGAPDLAVANEFSDDVSVLLGLGKGTFAPEQRFGVGGDPFSVSIGDLDGDGDSDLAVANFSSGDVSVLLNQRGAARSGLLAGRDPGERLERSIRVRPGPVRPARAGVATLTLRDLADAAAVGPRNLNARGQRAGSLTLDGAERPAIIDAGGRVTPIEIPAATAGQALAINDAGQAAGWYETESGEVRAFRADPGEPALDLGALGGGLTVALAINEAGDVAGYALDAEGREHAFLFSDGGGLRRLGNLGGGMARGLGVSDRDDGMVVGAAENALGDLLAFAWTEPSGVVDLNTVLPEDSELTLTVAEGFDAEGGVIARADDGLTERAVRLELEVLPPRTPGDLDGDGVVGAADLRRMIAAFGTPEASADLDGDGVVTAADVSTLVANWGAARE